MLCRRLCKPITEAQPCTAKNKTMIGVEPAEVCFPDRVKCLSRLPPVKKPVAIRFAVGPKFIADAVENLHVEDFHPEKIEDGCGGVYLLGDKCNNSKYKAIFKPLDEEIEATGYKGFIREFAAYLIDDNIAGVPATGIACIPWDTGVKLGALQQYVGNSESAADYGPAMFDKDDVHRIGVLDIRIVNCDRHSGNMLFCEKRKKLVPIDHGLSFPSAFTSLGQASFDWLLFPSAKQPFSKEVLREIEAIDIHRDLSILRSFGLGLGSELTLWMSTVLLKIGAKSGKTLYEIGSMVQRQGDRTQPSVLEELFCKALQIVKMYKVSFWTVFVECIHSYLNM